MKLSNLANFLFFTCILFELIECMEKGKGIVGQGSGGQEEGPRGRDRGGRRRGGRGQGRGEGVGQSPNIQASPQDLLIQYQQQSQLLNLFQTDRENLLKSHQDDLTMKGIEDRKASEDYLNNMRNIVVQTNEETKNILKEKMGEFDSLYGDNKGKGKQKAKRTSGIVIREGGTQGPGAAHHHPAMDSRTPLERNLEYSNWLQQQQYLSNSHLISVPPMNIPMRHPPMGHPPMGRQQYRQIRPSGATQVVQPVVQTISSDEEEEGGNQGGQ